MMDINSLLIGAAAVLVLAVFLWPREKKDTPNKQEAGCGCSTCECAGETIVKEKDNV